MAACAGGDPGPTSRCAAQTRRWTGWAPAGPGTASGSPRHGGNPVDGATLAADQAARGRVDIGGRQLWAESAMVTARRPGDDVTRSVPTLVKSTAASTEPMPRKVVRWARSATPRGECHVRSCSVCEELQPLVAPGNHVAVDPDADVHPGRQPAHRTSVRCGNGVTRLAVRL